MNTWQDVASPPLAGAWVGPVARRETLVASDLPTAPRCGHRLLEARRLTRSGGWRAGAALGGRDAGRAGRSRCGAGITCAIGSPSSRWITSSWRATASLARDEVLAVAGLAGPVSVWENLTEITARLESHPLVASARVTRELPSTLLVEIEEKTPVGLVASPLVVPVDRFGAVLPLDPTEPFLDLPVLRVVVARSATASCGACAPWRRTWRWWPTRRPRCSRSCRRRGCTTGRPCSCSATRGSGSGTAHPRLPAAAARRRDRHRRRVRADRGGRTARDSTCASRIRS